MYVLPFWCLEATFSVRHWRFRYLRHDPTHRKLTMKIEDLWKSRHRANEILYQPTAFWFKSHQPHTVQFGSLDMSFPLITLFSPVIKMFLLFGLKYVKYQWNEKSELESHIWLANLLDQCCFNLKSLLIVRFWFQRSRAGCESAFLTHSMLILLGRCEHLLFSSAVLNDWWFVGRHHAMLLWIASRACTF